MPTKSEKAESAALTKLDGARETISTLRKQLPPTGLARVGYAGGGGLLVGLMRGVQLGSVMGKPITSDILLTPIALAVDAAIDGVPPGGIAGKLVRTLNAASDAQVSDVAIKVGEAAVGYARLALTMNRDNSGQAGAATKPSTEHPVVDENGKPVS